MSKYLCRETILNANDIKTEEVNVPEWGGVVLVKSLTGSEKDKYEQSIYSINMFAKIILLTACHQSSDSVFLKSLMRNAKSL